MTYAKHIILSEEVRNRADAVPKIIDVMSTLTEEYARHLAGAQGISAKNKPRWKIFG